MGVIGLTPFLQKICPTVLKSLPNRLETLKGKRLVIDGTLITQRFHYVADRHPHQHILGWYKLVEELNENGVTAICVFDGKERSQAKARENARRRDVRRLASTRGSIEQERLHRLSSLKDTVQQFQRSNPMQRTQIAQSLRDAAFGEDGAATLLQESSLIIPEGEKEEIMPSELMPPIAPSIEPPIPSIELPVPSIEIPVPSIEVSIPTPSDVIVEPEPSLSPEDITSRLKSLYLSYKADVAKLVTLTVDSSAIPPTPISGTPTEDEKVEQVMTKAQYQLTVDEGTFWRESAELLTAPVLQATPLTLPPSTEEVLDSLVEKSYIMSSSFLRRTDSPTARTYAECKEILNAMGIPCIDANDAVEAEALASSMVRGGLADFVVSEDTDVLVYDAPLIKNITARHDSLVMVSGAEVRAELDLDRDSFIDFALLLGTDFSQRITNLGPARAFKFIKEYGSIERIVDFIESNPKFVLKLPRKAYLAQVDIARLVFRTLPPLPPAESLQALEKDDKKVAELLQRYGLARLVHDELWDYDAHYKAYLGGGYFGDDPRYIST